jgi:hypothetical protein
MFSTSSNSRSYSGGESGDIEQHLRGLLNQVTRGSFAQGADRRILICPLSDDIFSYKLSDNLARTAAASGSSVLLWDLCATDNVTGNGGKFCDLDSVMKAHNLIEAGISKRPDETIWEAQSTVRFRGNPKAISESHALTEAVRHLSKLFDLIIINCPPVGMLDEGYRAFAQHANSIIMVAKKGKTRKQEIARSTQITKGLPVAGFIMLE